MPIIGFFIADFVQILHSNPFTFKHHSELVVSGLLPLNECCQLIDHCFLKLGFILQMLDLKFIFLFILFKFVKLAKQGFVLSLEVLAESLDTSPSIAVDLVTHSDFHFADFFLVELC